MRWDTLLYYEPFAAAPLVEQATIVKIALLQRPINRCS
jgi:hypothetical protein